MALRKRSILINNITANKTHFTVFSILIFSIALTNLFFGIKAFQNPSLKIEWKTESEVDTLGFELYRKNSKDENSSERINPEIILARGSSIEGYSYQYMDDQVVPGKSYLYELHEIQLNNERTILDVINVQVKYKGLLEIGLAFFLIIVGIIMIIFRIRQFK